ncbi:MAG: hypothetical protein NWE88_03070 [Candidatus Bathyarchaeota archaeon]|nr:hypothetical protein [Candidatus Bathyarchaeota archaeon]
MQETAIITKCETVDLAASKAEKGELCSEAVLQALAEDMVLSLSFPSVFSR